MSALLVLPALLVFALWDMEANHGQWTLFVLRGLKHALHALGITIL